MPVGQKYPRFRGNEKNLPPSPGEYLGAGIPKVISLIDIGASPRSRVFLAVQRRFF